MAYQIFGLKKKKKKKNPRDRTLDLYSLCSATLRQLLEFWATFCAASKLEQLLPPRATFGQQMSHLIQN